MEIYRYLIDDVLVEYCRSLKPTDFIVKTEKSSRKKIGKRECFNQTRTRELMKVLSNFFESTVEIPRIQVGKKQSIETLINEESLLLAKYLRNEKQNWNLRITVL